MLYLQQSHTIAAKECARLGIVPELLAEFSQIPATMSSHLPLLMSVNSFTNGRLSLDSNKIDFGSSTRTSSEQRYDFNAANKEANVVRSETNGKVNVPMLDAAAQVLASSGPLNCKELIEAMSTQLLGTSPGGKTPHATLYAAIPARDYNQG